MVVTKDYDLPTVSGQPVNVKNWIDIPSEATGLRLRDVYVTDSNGNFSNIPRLNPEQVASYNNIGWNNAVNSWAGGYAGFYVQGTQLMIYPWQAASGQHVRLTFAQAPARLCVTTDAAQIIAIIGNNVTLGGTTAVWTTNTYLDAIKNDVPHNYVTDLSATQSLYSSPVPLSAIKPTAVAGSVLTFDPAVIASLSVGDWLAPYAFSPFVQFIPYEFVPVLVQLTAMRCLEAAGDRAGQAAATDKYKQIEADAINMISPRVIGKTRKVTNPNPLSRNTRMRSTRYVN
jgi:hypothetical protein